jgi:hypothetical protein
MLLSAVKYEIAVDIRDRKLSGSMVHSVAECTTVPFTRTAAPRKKSRGGDKGHDEIATPNPKDPKPLRQYKSRAKAATNSPEEERSVREQARVGGRLRHRPVSNGPRRRIFEV